MDDRGVRPHPLYIYPLVTRRGFGEYAEGLFVEVIEPLVDGEGVIGKQRVDNVLIRKEKSAVPR